MVRNICILGLGLIQLSCSLGTDRVSWISEYLKDDLSHKGNIANTVIFAGVSSLPSHHDNSRNIWLSQRQMKPETLARKNALYLRKIDPLGFSPRGISERHGLTTWSQAFQAAKRFHLCQALALRALDLPTVKPQEINQCPGIRIDPLAVGSSSINLVAFMFVQDSSYSVSDILLRAGKKFLSLYLSFDKANYEFIYPVFVNRTSIVVFNRNGYLEWAGSSDHPDDLLDLMQQNFLTYSKS